MQEIRWMNLFIPSRSMPYFSSSFHSTPLSHAKWKCKWKIENGGSSQQPKNYVRYITRHKRADTKRALKDLLFYGSISHFQDSSAPWGCSGSSSNSSHKRSHCKKANDKANGPRGKKHKYKKNDVFSDFNEELEMVFRATFGGRHCSWAFGRGGSWPGRDGSSEFEWRRTETNWTRSRNHNWETSSETDEGEDTDCVCEESASRGLYSDRRVLGLPSTGLLKVEEIKNAFRSSALKWHPDKHQGPHQAIAEEKFKHCVNAYQSLLKAMSNSM